MNKKKKVLVGGCFNTVHEGHLAFLKEAKSYGDYLVVVLSHDDNNKKPYAVSVDIRKKQVERLDFVDEVIVGDKEMYSSIKKVKPDIIVLGYDQKLPDKVIDSFNLKIVKLKKIGEYSTKNILGK